MFTLHATHQRLDTIKAQAYAVFCHQGFDVSHHSAALLTTFAPILPALVKQRSFTGSRGSSLVLTGQQGDQPVYVFLIGLGSADYALQDRLEHYRNAVGKMIRLAEQHRVTDIACAVPHESDLSLDGYSMAKELVATAYMASYHFDQFLTDPARKFPTEYTLHIVAPESILDTVHVGIEHGERIGHAVNQARHWCDLPPAHLTPTHLAHQAEKIAHAHPEIRCTVFNEADMARMNMGGILGVSRGSAEEARLVIMEYRTEHTDAPTIAIVGKGVTFDSGGLSIKPATGMEEMKDDMAGAACVISVMQALAHLKPAVNVIAAAPITENLPSGTALKPGDVITFYNGMTAEVKNTDAEGRLILADALAYITDHYAPHKMIDVATLTGSCAAALGSFFAGLMSQHEAFTHELLHAGRASGDRLWPLPFHDDYKAAIRCEVADICNIGKPSYRAGAITAGFFLQPFVKDTPWIHLDIAGVSFNVPDRTYFRPGATGFGVRLLLEYFMNYDTYAHTPRA